MNEKDLSLRNFDSELQQILYILGLIFRPSKFNILKHYKRVRPQTMGKDVVTMIKIITGDRPRTHLVVNLLSKNLCKANNRSLRCGAIHNGKTNLKVSFFSLIYTSYRSSSKHGRSIYLICWLTFRHAATIHAARAKHVSR